MIIGGLQKSSLIDYPAELAAVIFTTGCNFRCAYCHNPELVDPKLFQKPLSESEILGFLDKRKKQLDGVVITGGEPTLHNDLPGFIRKIKEMGYKVKLDTNGSNPEMIESLIKEKLVDYIAMDIKAPADKYPKITNVRTDMKQIKTSIKLIMEAAPKYEFRTTIVRSQLSFNDVLEIGKSIKDAELYVLQKFVPSKILDKTLMKEKTYEDDELEELRQKLEGYVKKCLVR